MDAKVEEKNAGKCPFTGTDGRRNRDWWPEALDISVLHRNSNLSNPMGKGFDYAKEFKSLDLNAVIKDLRALMTESQEWWPADFDHYGGPMIRMAQRRHLSHHRRPRRRRRGPAAFRAAQ